MEAGYVIRRVSKYGNMTSSTPAVSSLFPLRAERAKVKRNLWYITEGPATAWDENQRKERYSKRTWLKPESDITLCDRFSAETRKSSRPHSENGPMAIFPMRMTTGR